MSTSSPVTTIEASWADRLGIAASTLCVIHCVLTPVLLSMSVTFARLLPGEARTHRSLAVVVAAVGAIAIVRGLRTHRRLRVASLMVAGLACIFVGAFYAEQLPAHWLELAITLTGSTLLIAAHRLNHTFCRDCACATDATHSHAENPHR